MRRVRVRQREEGKETEGENVSVDTFTEEFNVLARSKQHKMFQRQMEMKQSFNFLTVTSAD
jgi:hypothetical protein